MNRSRSLWAGSSTHAVVNPAQNPAWVTNSASTADFVTRAAGTRFPQCPNRAPRTTNVRTERTCNSANRYAAIDSAAGVAGSGATSAASTSRLGSISTKARMAPTSATAAPTRNPSLRA